MRKQILIVDDEENITRYLYRTLRGNKYEIQIANTVKHALKIISKMHIDMLISDIKMPGITGCELLLNAKNKYPDIIRVILSGDAEKDTIIRLISNGTAHSYLMKPIKNQILKEHIARAFAASEFINRQKASLAWEHFEKIPVIPYIYDKLVLLTEKNKSIDTIASFISTNPEYTTKILQLANSSLSGIKKIGSINQALEFIGLKRLKLLVQKTDTFRSFIQPDIDFKEIELLWEHSRITNKLFHELYRKIYNATVPDQYSCCGIVLDIGMLFMTKHFPDELIKLRNTIRSDNLSLEQAEKLILGMTHSEMGAYLLKWWNLPSWIVESCLYHHDPLNQSVINKEICILLHIADYYSWERINKPANTQLIKQVFEYIPGAKKDIEKIIMELLYSEIDSDL